MRQQAFLQSVGVDRRSPVTVLSDSGDDISHACKLPAATARVLDWFHIGMRFEQLLLSLRGLHPLSARLLRPPRQLCRQTGSGPAHLISRCGIGSRLSDRPAHETKRPHALDSRSANSLLQVRCAVLNGQDVRNFKRWYPPGKLFAPLPRAHLLS